MEKKNYKERNAGVDLLRIVSMLMVVILHILGQGGVLAGTQPQSSGYAAAYLLETLSYCAVNCYALISGYVGAEGHFRYSRLFEIHARVLFYTVLITAGFFAYMPELIGFAAVKNAFFPVMTGQYWYYTAFFGVMLLEPALQFVTAHMPRILLRNLVLTIAAAFSLLPTVFVCDVFGINQGYSIWWLAALYLIGAYIKKYGFPFLKKAWIAALVYAACVAVTWGAHMLEAHGLQVPLPNLLTYPSPAMLLAGIALLRVFSSMKLPAWTAKSVCVLAPLSFSVYLIHVHPLIWEHFFAERFRALAGYPAAGLFFAVIGIAACVYILCSLADMARAWLFRVCRVSAACKKLGAWVEKILGTV